MGCQQTRPNHFYNERSSSKMEENSVLNPPKFDCFRLQRRPSNRIESNSNRNIRLRLSIKLFRVTEFEMDFDLTSNL